MNETNETYFLAPLLDSTRWYNYNLFTREKEWTQLNLPITKILDQCFRRREITVCSQGIVYGLRTRRMKLLFWLHFWTALGDTITISLREKRVVNRTLHWTSGTHFSSTIWQQLVHDMSSFWGGHRQNMNIALWWRRSVVSACRTDEKDALSSIPTTGHSWIALHCTTIGNYSYVGSIVSWSWCYAYY